MHELSVALGIVKIAEEETRKAGADKVEKIELEVGRLSGVELDALEFVWPIAVQDTLLEGAQREIYHVEGRGICLDCNREYVLNQLYDSCPDCNSNLKNITKGKELRVLALEVV